MTPTTREMRRLSHTILWRGAVLVALGIGAVLWSEAYLIAAMLAAGLVCTLSGLYEISIAISMRRQTTRWWLILADGLAFIVFGMLSVGTPAVMLRLALMAVTGWFLFYAGIAWSTAALFWSITRIRWPLIAWGCLNVGLGMLAVLYPAATILMLLFFGAVYAAMFGIWEMAVGLWLRRHLRSHAPSSHGAFAPSAS